MFGNFFILFFISSMWSSRRGYSQQAFYNSEAATLLCNHTGFWYHWLFFECWCSLLFWYQDYKSSQLHWNEMHHVFVVANWSKILFCFVLFFLVYYAGCWQSISCWFFFWLPLVHLSLFWDFFFKQLIVCSWKCAALDIREWGWIDRRISKQDKRQRSTDTASPEVPRIWQHIFFLYPNWNHARKKWLDLWCHEEYVPKKKSTVKSSFHSANIFR